MPTYVVRDVRLGGWKPPDSLDVNFDTPITWVTNRIKRRASKNLVVKFMCHGLPGYLQFANGSTLHPECGNGITISDLPFFKEIRGCLKRLELHACLVARIGSCPESSGMTAYDGNRFCFRLAQTLKAQVRASIHLQWYNDGTYRGGAPTGSGINFNQWNGRVFTWGPKGNIIRIQDFPYYD